MAGELGSKMKSMADMAIKSAKSTLGIKSPSTIFHGFGVNTVEGFNLGIDQKLPSIQAKMNVMADYAMKPFSSVNNSNSGNSNTYNSSTTYNYNQSQVSSSFGFLDLNSTI